MYSTVQVVQTFTKQKAKREIEKRIRWGWKMTWGREGKQEPKLYIPDGVQDLAGDGEGGDVFCVPLSFPVSSGHLSGSRWRPSGVIVSQDGEGCNPDGEISLLLVHPSPILPANSCWRFIFKAPAKGCFFSYLMFCTVWPICMCPYSQHAHSLFLFPMCTFNL